MGDNVSFSIGDLEAHWVPQLELEKMETQGTSIIKS